ncbi:site-specific integrase, partial [Candidatus Parcubacteria bacterium]
AIATNTFIYEEFFPGSKRAKRFAEEETVQAKRLVKQEKVTETPSFEDFALQWYGEHELEWRASYKRTLKSTLNRYLIPYFGERAVGEITKADILAFRASLAKVKAPGKTTRLSNARINKILLPLRQILNEAADRFHFVTPFEGIKPLKVPRTDVDPFTLEEVKRIIEHVRPDFKDYFIVRFFTGMRTGEIDGLKWQYVDFERRLILVRETWVNGQEEYTKTDGSQRDIQMNEMVYQALKRQWEVTGHRSKFVFCTRTGQPLSHRNVTLRVWYPLLKYLGIKPRRPYQTRHTAATLWLAAGEAPEWIARQLGHTSTEMLFRVYSRYVPNLTRRDGSAFERLLASNWGPAQMENEKKEGRNA